MLRSILPVFLFISISGFSQDFKRTNFYELEQLIQSSGDTLYIINFWATWCKPCIQELPYFDKVNELHQERKVKVILVSLDTEKNWEPALVPFLKRNKIQSEVWALYNQKPVDWIDRVSPQWSGAIPGTLFFVNGEKYFYEKEFTYESLETHINQFITN